MNLSLRRRLFLILSASVIAAWLATALFSYLDTRRLLGDMLDARLVETAELLVAMLGHGPPDAGSPIAAREAGADTQPMIAYRVWLPGMAQDKALRSPGMPVFADGAWRAGFSDRAAANERWRVYGARTGSGLLIEVAQRQAFRTAFAESVATHLMHPVWFAIPLLGLLIWLSVRWGLAPLQRIAENVESRSAANLAPLNAGRSPSEIRPLLDSLNRLFARIGVLLEKERRFTADAAHELRTPLAAIRTHAEVAQQARDEDERRRAIEHVIEGTDRASRLIGQLLVLARLDHEAASLAMMPVDLSDIAISAVMDEVSAAAAKGIDLGLCEDCERHAVIAGDAGLLRILLRNVLDNALRYTPADGKVTVCVIRRDGRAALQVVDTGPGIEAALRERVFDRFYRVAGSGEQGSGMGLSIVSAIAAIHGATVGLAAGPDGRGLAVEVTFAAENAMAPPQGAG